MCLCAILFIIFAFTPSSEFRSGSKASGAVLGASTGFVTADLPRASDSVIGPSTAEAAPKPSGPTIIDPTLNVEATAKAILAYDENDPNFVLVSQNIHDRLPIASLTKLMTALVVSESPNFGKPITLTAADELDVSPSLHLTAGDTVMPADLVKAMLIGSANDAAQALSNHFGNGGDFIELMNEKANALGMSETHFTTPIGFDTPNNFSTAADLQKLVTAALSEIPYDSIWRAHSYSFTATSGRIYSVKTSNGLIAGHQNIFSIKTGQTAEAGGNMIVAAESASGTTVNAQPRIISIVIGSSQREDDTLAVINYAFSNFTWSKQ